MAEFFGAISDWLTPDRVAMLMWMFSGAVQGLPQPNGSDFYRWLYRFAHFLAANIRVAGKDFTAKKPPALDETAEVNALLVARLEELGQKDWLAATLKEDTQPEAASGKE
jgi:hypothetical protein